MFVCVCVCVNIKRRAYVMDCIVGSERGVSVGADAAVKALNTKAPEVAVCLLSKSPSGDKVACLTSVPQVYPSLLFMFMSLAVPSICVQHARRVKYLRFTPCLVQLLHYF